MKIAHFKALRQIEIAETDPPALSRPADVLLQIDRVGVCGSDVHYYTEGRIGDQVVEYPATIGHECAGTVLEVGREVAHIKPGDRVAVDPAISCGRCDQCRAGRENTCRNLQFMGCPGEAPGVAAQRDVLPARNCFPVPDTISLDEAALVEPLSIGLHAVRLSRIAPGARIGILGCGPIGLSVLQCARMTANCTAYVTDLIGARREVARQCGADWTGNPRQTDVLATLREEQPLGLDLVFECSGDPACLDQATELVAPGGTVLMVGIPPQDRVDFDTHLVRRDELSLQGVRRQQGCVAPVIEAIAAGRIDTRPLLTHRFPLDRMQEAFELVAGYEDGVAKAMIEVSPSQA